MHRIVKTEGGCQHHCTTKVDRHMQCNLCYGLFTGSLTGFLAREKREKGRNYARCSKDRLRRHEAHCNAYVHRRISLPSVDRCKHDSIPRAPSSGSSGNY